MMKRIFLICFLIILPSIVPNVDAQSTLTIWQTIQKDHFTLMIPEAWEEAPPPPKVPIDLHLTYGSAHIYVSVLEYTTSNDETHPSDYTELERKEVDLPSGEALYRVYHYNDPGLTLADYVISTEFFTFYLTGFTPTEDFEDFVPFFAQVANTFIPLEASESSWRTYEGNGYSLRLPEGWQDTPALSAAFEDQAFMEENFTGRISIAIAPMSDKALPLTDEMLEGVGVGLRDSNPEADIRELEIVSLPAGSAFHTRYVPDPQDVSEIVQYFLSDETHWYVVTLVIDSEQALETLSPIFSQIMDTFQLLAPLEE